MNDWWDRVKCAILGKCRIQRDDTSDTLRAELFRGLEETKEMKQEVKRARETGIWPQDLLKGTYRPQRERRGHS